MFNIEISSSEFDISMNWRAQVAADRADTLFARPNLAIKPFHSMPLSETGERNQNAKKTTILISS
jgi:hypothetical protein